MNLAAVSLDDKYTATSGRVFMTGMQALVRLPMLQRDRDLAVGLNTGGFVSGYRGSPLGGYDQALWQASEYLQSHHIRFVPGVNEDLALTSAWGSQQLHLYPDAKYDGVFAIWYGKGPGVDRSGDVFKQGNGHGTAKYGGILAIAGDDPAAKSSTSPHQTEHVFIGAFMPVLVPAGVQEFIDYGLLGIALSRYSGLWVGFKTLSDNAESTEIVDIDPARLDILLPKEFELPSDGVSLRWPDDRFEQEQRLHEVKVPAALAFCKANSLNQAVISGPTRRFGIVTAGKAYLDVRQALDDLGIDERSARELGIAVYKVGMVWPLEPEGVMAFARGLDEILVIEEKRGIVEEQLKGQLYHLPDGDRPRVVGKTDEFGASFIPVAGELGPAIVARAIAKRIAPFHAPQRVADHLAFLDSKDAESTSLDPEEKRTPYFCSGCPHNTGTKLPDGSFANAGIGCHWMSLYMDRSTLTFTQMGGEGATWIGLQPFTNMPHIFQNMGDGTFYHSGVMAIRANVAANSNITYKVLFNDAVAMTGGQPIEGQLSVHEIAWQVHAEGVKKIAIASDEPDKYPIGSDFPPGTTIHHRDDLIGVQKDLRDTSGVTVLIYDQTCAAEKRRRRKRGLYPDPAKRVFINERVCEGCGDCSVKANCVSIEPLETEFGRKRVINQSSCNKDFSCVDGFCPSFVTVHGGGVRKLRSGADVSSTVDSLPDPELPSAESPYGVVVTGVGGTGVVTIGALLGMAAHLEGKGCSILDMTGLAQKGGAVISHVRIAETSDRLHAVRLGMGAADVVLGCDMVVAADDEALKRMRRGATHAVINSRMTPTSHFTLNPDIDFHETHMCQVIRATAGDNLTDFVDATGLATALIGDAIATNLFLTGYAYQRGLIPVSAEAIARAIELNGIAVESNLRAFNWGRAAAHDLTSVEAAARPTLHRAAPVATELDEVIRIREVELSQYQDGAYASRYRSLVDRVRAVETAKGKGLSGLSESVARMYFKLMAYKDEYEVARLYADPKFSAALNTQFEGDFTLRFHLAPPLGSRRDPVTGELEKKEFGPWVLILFRVLAKLKRLRGTAFDIFGHTRERRMERQLISEYEGLVEEILGGLAVDNHALAIEIASLPEQIRGYGHVKERNVEAVRAQQQHLLSIYRNPSPHAHAAE
ncbi:MAG: indolepyruvate ferredoxin oxidoreductase [Alphaproteobacteria bacterium]|nr:indolepyruvate ferredoxin oxidoreductase [Alphaproteobacteria bacterium]|tara:strand:+ start:12262 stop:15732 length:3471 start_codon:yes stop_codon:yes gene_type:complete